MWGVICRVALPEGCGGYAADADGHCGQVDCLVETAAGIRLPGVSAIDGLVDGGVALKKGVVLGRDGPEWLVRVADDERRVEDVMGAGAEA